MGVFMTASHVLEGRVSEQMSWVPVLKLLPSETHFFAG